MSLFPEWLEKHKDDPKILPRRITAMHGMYGKAPGVCGACRHFYRKRLHNRVYFKCQKSTITAGAGTDWRAGWPACGLFEGNDEQSGLPEKDS